MIGVPLPSNDDMIRISAEQRIDFLVKNKQGRFRVSNTGEVTELTEEEWQDIFNGDEL